MKYKIKIKNPIIGVPITFMNNFSSEQFEIVGRTGDLEWCENECNFFTPPSEILASEYKKQDKTWRVQNGYLLEKSIPKTTYGRIFVKKRVSQ